MSEGDNIIPLRDLCLYYCISHYESFLESLDNVDSAHKCSKLPRTLSDCLLDEYIRSGCMLNQTFMKSMSDPSTAQLSRVVATPLDTGNFDPSLLHDLTNHRLNILEICCCTDSKRFTFENLFSSIQKLQDSIRILKVHQNESCSHCEEIGQDWIQNCVTNSGEETVIKPVLNLPNLTVLWLRHFHFQSYDIEYEGDICEDKEIEEFFSKTFSPLTNLTVLDFSGCSFTAGCLTVFADLPKLSKLCLADVKFDVSIEEAIEYIVKIKTLRYLDISSCLMEEVHKKKVEGENMLHYIISELPCLDSLDISFRNFADSLLRPINTTDDPSRLDTNFPAFCGRRFKFLGLWGCNTGHQTHFPVDLLPVDQITGDDSEDQLLFSLHVYKTHPSISVCVFEKLLESLPHREFSKPRRVISDTLDYLQSYRFYPAIACLYYALAHSRHETLEQVTRARVLGTIISLIMRNQTATDDHQMVKVCLLVFLELDIPHDAVCCYMLERFVACLVYVLRKFKGGFHEKFGLRLIHEVCRGDPNEKKTAVEAGVMEVLYHIIQRKVRKGTADQNLERAWSCLWSLTDVMPSNCEKFLTNEKAVQLFFRCVEKFGTETGLIRKLTGVMANVSEVKELRPLLMNNRFIPFFGDLLSEDSTDTYDIDVCYHAAGILSEIIVDGPEAWTLESPSRDEITKKITVVVKSWDVTTCRKIKYRSLSPLIRMAQVFAEPSAQLWGVWALCNLIKVKADRYCPMLRYDGGVPVVESIVKDPRCQPYICDLATTILTDYNAFRATEISGQGQGGSP